MKTLNIEWISLAKRLFEVVAWRTTCYSRSILWVMTSKCCCLALPKAFLPLRRILENFAKIITKHQNRFMSFASVGVTRCVTFQLRNIFLAFSWFLKEFLLFGKNPKVHEDLSCFWKNAKLYDISWLKNAISGNKKGIIFNYEKVTLFQ